jgi:hypothetical protein
MFFDLLAGDLAAEHEHGRGSGVGRAEPRGGVEEPRARDHERCPDAAARPRVAVGHVAGRLLVARGDEADARLVAQRRHHPVELDAGQAEDDPYAFAIKRRYRRFAPVILAVSVRSLRLFDGAACDQVSIRLES